MFATFTGCVLFSSLKVSSSDSSYQHTGFITFLFKIANPSPFIGVLDSTSASSCIEILYEAIETLLLSLFDF
jgi:hypothetical protein